MTHASVFSGIGGPEVAAAMLGWENLFHCEINPFGRAVLDYWFPNSKSYEDITKTDFSEWGGRVNVLTGGFPCQPFSYAGQRRGADDDRYLWPFMHRCINQVRPDWVVCENVAGILTMVEQGDVTEMAAEKSLFDEVDTLHRYRLDETFTLERICQDLESDGYAVQAVVIPACAVGAPHRRDRVFIIGNRNDAQNTMRCGQLHGQYEVSGCERNFGDIGSGGSERICRETQGVDSSNADSIGQSTHGRHCGREREKMDKRSGDKSFNGVERFGSPRFVADTTSKDGNRGSAQVRQERETITNNKEHTIFPSTERFGGERAIAHPDCNRGSEMDEHLQPRLADGAKPVGNGRERIVTDTENKPCKSYKFGEQCVGNEKTREFRRGISGADPKQPFAHTSQQCGQRNGFEQPECGELQQGELGGRGCKDCGIAGCGRWDAFPTVSPVHRGNDGLPFPLDDLTISPSKWRTESLKAYGNAIVPQVMYEIFKAIEATYQQNNQEQRQ